MSKQSTGTKFTKHASVCRSVGIVYSPTKKVKQKRVGQTRFPHETVTACRTFASCFDELLAMTTQTIPASTPFHRRRLLLHPGAFLHQRSVMQKRARVQVAK